MVVALTWGGVKYPWISAQVLGPLIVGLVGLGAFLVYEALYAKEPLVRVALRQYLPTESNGASIGSLHPPVKPYKSQRVRPSHAPIPQSTS